MEFQIRLGEDGRTKVMEVTGLDGSSVQGSKRDSYDGGKGDRGGRSGSGWRSDRGGNGGGVACHKYGDYGNLARDCTLKETTLVGSVVTDATIAKRKGTLLENAIILPQCDEEKR